MKHSYLLFILFFGVFHSQQLKVVDAESGSPVPNARILLKDQIVYTNEDGIAPVSSDAPAFEVSASGYQKAEVRNFSPQIRLKPLYKDIGEIKIVNVDVKKIFEDVAKNYHKRYYNAPSLYDVVYKEKSFDNSKLFFLVIAEAKLWASDNMYNFKQGLRKDYDEILQMQLNNVKYLKNIKSDSIFTGKTNEFSHEYLGNFFLNFELYRELQHLKMKETKCTGRLIFEEGNEQLITFKISSANGVHMNGEFKYNTADKAITYFETHYFQENYPVVQRKTTDGKTFDYKLGDASLIFDFYKKNGSYIPAMTRLEGDKFTSYYNDETHVRKFSREMVYNTFTPSDKKGLDPKVDFKISIWNNDTVKENKVNTTLLSEEEKAFVNGK
ncbi:carboxypeptidase-like regulatory domain-containing protein [Chryseobacterium arthrosphaerae]|uniref:carboxypeptidase-like regulatory domain-containing protein n=1 Tax=Chryseobacterium arthrosphaerae TaxID=651561 RepID=UPI001F4B45BF|nr:carboxypeptidase-like regulatory domain-containing protein [Chryseobacterium arthrosphaerae]MDG4652510.1 carboxypeptidase-like regulatory domain-containing protein [Chryseobacterium arthrosphaerae]